MFCLKLWRTIRSKLLCEASFVVLRIHSNELKKFNVGEGISLDKLSTVTVTYRYDKEAMSSWILLTFLIMNMIVSIRSMTIESKETSTTIVTTECNLTCDINSQCYANADDILSCLSSIPFNKVRMVY